MTPADLLAKLEIRETLVRYCRGVDRGDLALVDSTFHPDAIDERGAQKDSARVTARRTLERLDGFDVVGHHNLTNITIELSGRTALVESYFSAWVPDATDRGTVLTQVIGRYLDRLEKRDGAWKIAHRKIVIDAAEPGKRRAWARGGGFFAGARREDDPAHAFFAESGDTRDSDHGEQAMTLQEAMDHMELRELLVRYCRGIDRGIKPLVNSVYHDDSTDDHGTYNGPGLGFADVVVDRMDQTGVIGQHNVTNVAIELDGEMAKGESYFITFNPEADAQTGEGGLMLVLGRYLDVFERRDGQWKIVSRRVVIDHAQPSADGTPWPRLKDFSIGGRREADPGHGFLKN